jgi:hypothetical protein
VVRSREKFSRGRLAAAPSSVRDSCLSGLFRSWRAPSQPDPDQSATHTSARAVVLDGRQIVVVSDFLSRQPIRKPGHGSQRDLVAPELTLDRSYRLGGGENALLIRRRTNQFAPTSSSKTTSSASRPRRLHNSSQMLRITPERNTKNGKPGGHCREPSNARAIASCKRSDQLTPRGRPGRADAPALAGAIGPPQTVRQVRARPVSPSPRLR